MTTQYTTILKLALPVQGELSGTWGDVVNDNITQMVEQAVAGLAVIDSWTANSHTLTTADGTTSESRCAMLSFTDTGTALTGAGTVICPANSKVYIAKNTTGQVITLKTSAGTGIAIPNGKSMLLFCDGTNVVEAVDHVVTLSAGTLTVTGLTTFASLKGTDTTTVTTIKDEDDMSSDSATALATQQSIKAYVDSQVGTVDTLAEILANGNTTGANDIEVDTTQKVQFRDTAIYINSSADGQLDIVADTEVQIATTTLDLNGILDVSGNTTLGADVTFTGASYNAVWDSSDNALEFADNAKAVFGAGSDLQIFHDASDSYIVDNGTGDLILQAGNDLILRETDGTTEYLRANEGAGVQIYHNGSQKFLTTSTGIDVTGQVVADGGDFTGQVQFNGTAGIQLDDGAQVHTWALDDNFTSHFNIGSSSTSAAWIFGSNNANYWTVSPGGIIVNQDGADVDFRVESDTNTHMLFVDAGAGHVNIGQSTDSNGLLNVAGITVSDAVDNGFRVVRGSAAYYGQLWVNYEDSKVNTYIDSIASTSFVGQIIARTSDSASTITEQFKLSNGVGAIFNETGADLDFRVESDANAHMLFVDASENEVIIGASDNNALSSNVLVVAGDTSLGNRQNNNASPFTTELSGLSITNGTDWYGSYGSLLFHANASWTGSARQFLMTNGYKGNQFVLLRGTGTADTIPSISATGGNEVNATEIMTVVDGGHVVFNDGSFDQDFRVESNNNANMLFVDAGNDRVGIGYNTPQATLDIKPPTIAQTGTSEVARVNIPGANIFATSRGNINFSGWDVSNADVKRDVAYIGLQLVADTSSTAQMGGTLLFDTCPIGAAQVPLERLRLNNDYSAVFNEPGNDYDFRVESDTNPHMLFVDAGNDRVGVGTGSPGYLLDVLETNTGGLADLRLKNAATTDAASGARNIIQVANGSVGDPRLVLSIEGTQEYAIGIDNSDSDVLKFNNGSDPSTSTNYLSLGAGAAGVVVNDGSDAAIDFRVESDDNANMLRVDAGENRVITGSSSVHSIGTTNPPLQVGDYLTFQNYGVNSNVTTDTGISINQGNNGMAMQVLASNHSSTGTSTLAGQYFLKFYYDGNNAPTSTLVAGDDLVTFGVSGSNTLTITMPAGGNSISFITNG